MWCLPLGDFTSLRILECTQKDTENVDNLPDKQPSSRKYLKDTGYDFACVNPV